jgi:5-methylcytosine-specific restriction endonuclease McrA
MKYLQQELTESGYGDLAYCRYAYDRHGAPLLDELVAVLDHVQPFSMGGTEDTKNLATACNRCNMQKNNYDAEEWEHRHPIKPIKSKSG